MGILRAMKLLLYKNFLVRKRCWLSCLVFEILIPFGLFLMMECLRENFAKTSRKIESFTYFEPMTKSQIMKNYDFQNYVIYYVPLNDFTASIMKEVNKCISPNGEATKTKIQGFKTEKDATLYLNEKKRTSPSRNFSIIIFNEDINSTTRRLVYKIRTPKTIPGNIYISNFNTSLDVPYEELGRMSPTVQLQICLDEVFIKTTTSDANALTEISLQRMPEPPFVEFDEKDSLMRLGISIIALLAFFFPLICETKYSLDEKHINVNVPMAMHGVSYGLNITSWLISSLIFNTILVTLTVAVLSFNIFSKEVVPFLNYSDKFLFWLMLFFVTGNMFAFGIHAASNPSKPSFIFMEILFTYAFSSILQYVLIRRKLCYLLPFIGIFCPNILLFRIFDEVNSFENFMDGIKWNNLFKKSDPSCGVAGNCGMMMIFSVVGIIANMILAIYTYEISPGKYGVAKHPLYFLNFLRSKSRRISFNESNGNTMKQNKKLFEVAPDIAYTPKIKIRHLYKTYSLDYPKNTKVSALSGLTIDFYSGQTTAILGRNGSGKTTLLSILTGMTKPTDGEVVISGRSTKNGLKKVLKSIGSCPQENMIFPKLSVFQQVKFFAMLKNANKSCSTVNEDVNLLLKKLNIFEKRHCLPINLSDGQKRSTCLGMALIGNSDILVLDEPTSGMDPKSKRCAWNAILRMRGKKTILISTHDMEEADILADRIAIIDNGVLKSYATSMYLKKKFGQGNLEVSLFTVPNVDPEPLQKFLGPRGRVVDIENCKMNIQIPNTPNLPELLDELERQKTEFGIRSMKVSIITLEEVFLKIMSLGNQNVAEFDAETSESSENKDLKIQTNPSYSQTVSALFKKKVVYTKKNISTIFTMFLLPSLAVLLCFYNVHLEHRFMPSIFLSLSVYSDPLVFYNSDKETFKVQLEKIAQSNFALAAEVKDSNFTGVLASFGKNDGGTYRMRIISALKYADQKAVIYYNEKPFFSLPISINLFSNAILKSKLGDNCSISAYIGPQTDEIDDYFEIEQSTMEELRAHLSTIVFVILFFPAVTLFTIHPLREARCQIKALQFMAGVHGINYWGIMYLVDLMTYIIMTFVVVGLALILDNVAFNYGLMRELEMGLFILSFILFGASVLPMIYVFSCNKGSSGNAFRFLILLPITLITIDIIFLVLRLRQVSYSNVLRHITKIFYLVPHVSFFDLMVGILRTGLVNAKCRRMPDYVREITCEGSNTNSICCSMNCSGGNCQNPLPYMNHSADVIQYEFELETKLAFLLISIVIYLYILTILESHLLKKSIIRHVNFLWKPTIPEDVLEDRVKKEKQNVELEIYEIENNENLLNKVDAPDIPKPKVTSRKLTKSETDFEGINMRSLLVYELHKRYKKDLIAVENVTFGLRRGQCLGILGINGAGKSTIFNILSGFELPNLGNVYVSCTRMDEDRKRCLSQMSYCPQNEALIDSLNAYDHLKLFARIKGVPNRYVESEVDRIVHLLGLDDCASRRCGTYSSGNRRRLTIAMALIGNPKIILLDEPSTGVDQAARRCLWKFCQRCQKTGQSILLTSHSMDECENLCDRVAIMLNGKFVCIGNCKELKQRFEIGCNIKLKLNLDKSMYQIDQIKEDLKQSLKGQITDENLGHLIYHVEESDVSWMKLYSIINELIKKNNAIENFTIQSSTFEQLFLKLTNNQTQS